ncbi:hypothetical protein HX849_01900, partial [Marine Group I thaumarchaeote]|nr:hypothetical protein [Marine Group I thaumarchaeote]
MKNEIGRKLTSLTIMAIMLGGLGIAQGFTNSYMPVASAQTAETSGMLSVSSTNIQGAAILEIVVNDPDISDTTVDINSGATVTVLGTSYDMVQAVNGKWYAYVVDNSVATLMDADSNGMEFGLKCSTGLGTGLSATIIPSGTIVWSETISGQTGATDSGSCLDADNMRSKERCVG